MAGTPPNELPADIREKAELAARAGAKLVTENPRTQAWAMRRILEDHPNLYRLSDLVRAITNGKPTFHHTDDMRCCLDELVRAGVLSKIGEEDYLVIPTIPALHMDAILPVAM